jgi:outer membrane receptor protein involved in Fe transport
MKAFSAPILVAALLVVPSLACAAGALHGVISAEDGGDRLSGASVLLLGTTIGAATDLDGEYRIEDIPPGTYEVRASFEGYDSKILSDVVIGDRKATKLNIKLMRRGGASASFTIDDLVVTADRVLSTEVALITERMKSITIGDAISAERISKSPDGSGSDVLKRITGLQVVDSKFVYVRGMTDRYNTTWLDGVPVSSTDTDVDRRSFTYDVLPSSLLSSAVVVKSASPDLPGDFSGGLVQLNTHDIPAERGLSLSVSSGYDDGTTGTDILRSLGSGTDALGMDDGSRDIPDYDRPTGNNHNALAHKLTNSWITHSAKAPMNSSYSLSYGDRYDFGHDDGRHVMGIIAGAKYDQSFERVNYARSPVDETGYGNIDYQGTKDRYEVIWSGLLNLAYGPTPGHQFSARGLYIQDARDQVGYAEGWLSENAGPGGKSYSIEWDERSRASAQLGGTHEFGRRLKGPRFEWKVFGSESKAHEPDRKQADYARRADGTESLSENTRSWTDLNEDGLGTRADFTLPLGAHGATEVKVGTFLEKRERTYRTDAYWTDVSTVRSPNYWIRVLPVDEIHEPENYGHRKLTFRLKTAFTGEYDGTHDVEAYYAMINHPFAVAGNRVRIAGGARVEHSKQLVEAIQREGDQEPVISEIDKTDVLPSINLTYMPTEWTNVRLGYFVSVNRPELREIAAIKYRDFNEDNTVQGNPDLKRSVIQNFDLRLEAFPGSDEVLAVSYFYKEIQNAIEEKLIPSSDYRHIRTWFNSDWGHNHGLELEIRKSLGFLGNWLEDVTASGNYTRAFSSVEYLYEWRWQDDEGDWHTSREIRTRPLQGQAPWTINLGLRYENAETGTSVTVLYNKIARRLDKVTLDQEDNLWEEPRDLLDFAVTQKLFHVLQLKLTGKNLLEAEKLITLGDHAAVDTRETEGRSISLSLGLRL